MRAQLPVFACCMFCAVLTPCGAAETFSGAVAAQLDWSVRACEFKSTDKSRSLVDQAKAAGEAKFSDQYMKAFGSKEIAEANGNKSATGKLCEKILEWYGPAGSRVAGLIAKATDPVPTPSSKSTAPAEAKKGGRHRRNM